MKNKLIKINDLPFIEANKIFLELLKKNNKFSLSDIEIILNFKEKELTNIFFNEYKYFVKDDFLYIEKFINNNFNHFNKDFVSDLIYFAVDFGLDLDYQKILSTLVIDKEDNDCLVLACLEYINMNFKFLYIDEIIKNLNSILNKTIYHQNEQLLSSLILYRITYKPNYLNFIQELINYDSSNLEFLNNSLKSKVYDEKYFNYNEFDKKIKYKKRKPSDLGDKIDL